MIMRPCWHAIDRVEIESGEGAFAAAQTTLGLQAFEFGKDRLDQNPMDARQDESENPARSTNPPVRHEKTTMF
jgi:hypothetical protein